MKSRDGGGHMIPIKTQQQVDFDHRPVSGHIIMSWLIRARTDQKVPKLGVLGRVMF
jgi:hypothetical protein